MREGEAVTVATFLGGGYSPAASLVMPGMVGLGLPESGGEQKILWRERTGSKTGWLMKSDEERTMKITGRRCVKCGHIELRAQETT